MKAMIAIEAKSKAPKPKYQLMDDLRKNREIHQSVALTRNSDGIINNP
jgi:hypothetical protein